MVSHTGISTSARKHPVIKRRDQYDQFHQLRSRRHDDVARARRRDQPFSKKEFGLGSDQFDMGARYAGEIEGALYLLLVRGSISP